MDFYPSEEQRPVLWIGGRAIHAAVFVVLVFAASLLVTTVLMAINRPAPLAWLDFDSAAILRGEVWRVATYGLHNPPSLWFVVDLAMIVWFGREVERFFGRNIFLLLFAGLYLVTPLILLLLGLWQPIIFFGATGALGVFIAFATLYPHTLLLFNISAQIAAAVLLGIFTLIFLANRQLSALASLWATSAFAFGFIRYQQGRFHLPRLRLRSRATPSRPATPPPPPRDQAREELDALLDKIARSGLASLTAAERTKLETASAKLSPRRPPPTASR